MRKVVLAVCGIIAVCFVSAAISQENAEGDVLAIVDGKSIRAQEVFKSETPGPVGSKEKRKLAEYIVQRLREDAVKAADISVSEEEIDQRIEANFEAGGMNEEQAARMREKFVLLAEALERWQAHPEKDQEIYKTILSPTVELTQWSSFKKCYNTPERLQEMKKHIPQDLEDMKRKSRESTRKEVESDKWLESTGADLSVSDEELKSLYEKKYGRKKNPPELKKVSAELRFLIRSEKEAQSLGEWRNEALKESSITIVNPEYNEVLEMLKPSDKQ